MTPTQVLGEVLSIVSSDDWRLQPTALEQLRPRLMGDPFGAQFEFFGVPTETTVSEKRLAPELTELLVHTQSLPYRAVLALDCGDWKLKEFLAQCTGCLGTGKILERACNSCSGTGWGMRPS